MLASQPTVTTNKATAYLPAASAAVVSRDGSAVECCQRQLHYAERCRIRFVNLDWQAGDFGLLSAGRASGTGALDYGPGATRATGTLVFPYIFGHARPELKTHRRV